MRVFEILTSLKSRDNVQSSGYSKLELFGKGYHSKLQCLVWFSMDPPCRRTPTDDSIKSCMFCLVVSCYKKEEIGKCKDDLLAICYFTLLYVLVWFLCLHSSTHVSPNDDKSFATWDFPGDRTKIN